MQYSSSAPRSPGSATVTSSARLNNTNTSHLKIDIVVLIVLLFSFLVFVFVVWWFCRRPGPYHRDAPHARKDSLIKAFTFWGNSDVKINPSPEHPPPLLHVSVPRPPTTQALPESGVDLSSGLQGLPESGVDLSSGLLHPVNVSRPPTSQAVLDNADHDISSGFGALQRPLPPPHHPPPGRSFGCSKIFRREELEAATDNFSPTNLLGEGAFAHVYRGTLPGGRNIAVKWLKVRGREGEREFQAEVEAISRVHHRYLVSSLGYCIADDQRLLVCEFVPNNTLKHHLHGEGQPSMEWPTRLKIANGVARGLAYLHEDCSPNIIHRDIKASNILLDSNFGAKIADFGLAKLVSQGSPCVNTTPQGTIGYLDPEYFKSGELTEKSDVFSFGVVVLELITGRQAVDLTVSFPKSSLVYSTRRLLARAMADGNLDSLVDRRLQNNYTVNDMMRVVACAASCIQDHGRCRPSMQQIVRVLEGDVSPDKLQQSVPGIQAGTLWE